MFNRILVVICRKSASVQHEFTEKSRKLCSVAARTTAAYVAIARRHGLDPAHMALAFVNRQRFVTSTVIGATTMAQLATNVASVDVRLSDEVLKAIEEVHKAQPNPCP